MRSLTNLELVSMCATFSSRFFCFSLRESLSIYITDNLLCRLFTVAFKFSIFESKLHSFAWISSNFSSTPSHRFKAAITSSSPLGLVTSGELDSFARFSTGDASEGLQAVLRLNFLFGVEYTVEHFIDDQKRE